MKFVRKEKKGKESWLVVCGLRVYYCKEENLYKKKRFLCFRWISVQQDLLLKSLNRDICYIKNQLAIRQLADRKEFKLFPKEQENCPVVSVIVPIFNNEEFLNKSIDSVLSQTIDNIEVICINDGSQDESLNILRKYEDKDKRVRVFTQENSGAGVARNLGLDKSRGKYIFFIDGDDILPNDLVLETLIKKAEEFGADIVGGSQYKFLPDGSIKQDFDGEDAKLVFKKDEWIDYREYQFDFGYQRFIYARKLIENNNIRFPVYRRFQDPPFFVNCMKCAGKF